MLEKNWSERVKLCSMCVLEKKNPGMTGRIVCIWSYAYSLFELLIALISIQTLFLSYVELDGILCV